MKTLTVFPLAVFTPRPSQPLSSMALSLALLLPAFSALANQATQSPVTGSES